MTPLGGDASHSSEGSRRAGYGAAVGIAACVDRFGTEKTAASILRANNAHDVGRAEGVWRDGSWRDFDPRRPLATV